jgi:hypothetical protein
MVGIVAKKEKIAKLSAISRHVNPPACDVTNGY